MKTISINPRQLSLLLTCYLIFTLALVIGLVKLYSKVDMLTEIEGNNTFTLSKMLDNKEVTNEYEQP